MPPYQEKFKVIIKEEKRSERNKNDPNECFPNIPLTISDQEEIFMEEIHKKLSLLGYNFENKTISIYDNIRKMYVFCGKSNKLLNLPINTNELIDKTISLKCKEIPGSLLDEIFEQSELSEKMEEEIKDNFNKNKRTKERTIKDVVKNVALWRKLYNGFYDQNSSQIITKSLEEGAKKIGISKKTLDDYLSQIRLGKKFGFNFNKEQNSKIGVLRAFVKNNKEKKKNKSEDNDG